MAPTSSDPIPPYIAYRTFGNFMRELKARGLPARIDRSVMAHKSGTVQSQLLLALRYLGLIKESGHPTRRLKRLLESDHLERKTVLREALEASYSFVFSPTFGLETATSDQAEELFQRTGASGETVRRCLSFFLAAARESGISVSPYIKPHQRRRSGSRKRVAVNTASTKSGPTSPVAEGEAKKIHLKSGGSLRLELSGRVFDLDERDREFVFKLIDQLKEHEKEERTEAGSPNLPQG